MYQMLSNRQSLVENKQHNQIPMYTYVCVTGSNP